MKTLGTNGKRPAGSAAPKLAALLFAPLLVGLAACSAGKVDSDQSSADANDDSGAVPECTSGCETGIQQTPEQARQVCAESVTGPQLLRRLTAVEIDATLKDIFPEAGRGWTTRMSVDIGSKLGFSNDASTLVVGGSTANELLKTAQDLGDLIIADTVLPQVLPCAADSADAACATDFVQTRGLRLFRRPLTDDEVKRYVDYQQSVAKRADFKTGIKWVTVAMVQSPNAIYRSEIGKPADGGGYDLDQYERATELAYVYSGTTPDQELLDAARDGKLETGEQLKAQAQRLLSKSLDSLATMNNFFFEWLEYGKVRGQSRVNQGDFDFAQSVSIDMLTETKLYLQTIVIGDNGTAHDLMTATYTGLNGQLSAFYGYGGLDVNSGFEKVERPAGQGIGILAQGSILAGTAHQAATSPTLRGLLFFRRFLCNTKPKPPDIVPPIEAAQGVDEAKTTRQKFEEHHAIGTCGKCHKPFEPFGYTMEHFDELGKYRSEENGTAVDSVATVVLNDGTSVEVKTQEELAQLVDQTDDIENCMSGLMAAYMFSGAGGQHCLAEDQRREFAAGTASIQEFYLSLTQAPHFTHRRGDAAASAGN
jgi:uncharacterized protein (DUF4415 family)